MLKAIILICYILLIATGCSKGTSEPADKGSKIMTGIIGEENNKDLYSVEANSDYTYNYEIKDIFGNVLISDKNIPRQPRIEAVFPNVLKLSVQTGIGKATEWSVYCDVMNSSVSDTYYYVLAENDNKVMCVEFYEKYHVVIRDIFNSERIYGGTVLEDTYAIEPIVECEILDGERARIVYLKGKEYIKTELIINID